MSLRRDSAKTPPHDGFARPGGHQSKRSSASEVHGPLSLGFSSPLDDVLGGPFVANGLAGRWLLPSLIRKAVGSDNDLRNSLGSFLFDSSVMGTSTVGSAGRGSSAIIEWLRNNVAFPVGTGRGIFCVICRCEDGGGIVPVSNSMPAEEARGPYTAECDGI